MVFEGSCFFVDEGGGRIGCAAGRPSYFLFQQSIPNSQLGIEDHVAARRNPFAFVGVKAGGNGVCHESTQPRNHEAVVIVKQ